MTTFLRIVTSILLVGSALGACAQGGEVPIVDVCKLVTNSGQYNQQRIELHANVVAEPHGYHLVEKECPDGSVGLVIPEQSNNDAKFTNMMRQVMAHHAKGRVVITGVFHVGQVNRQVGTLVIDDVLSVETDS